MRSRGIERLRLPAPAGAPSVRSVRAHLAEIGTTDLGAWSNGPGFRYGAHRHAHTKVLMCAEGSITFLLEGGDVTLAAGDGFVLPPQTSHAAEVGPEGVTCVEGRRG